MELHRQPRARRLVGALIALVVASILGTLACGGDDGPAAPATIGGVTGPVVVDAASLDGSTVEVARGQVIDVRVGASDVTTWEATVADRRVIEFVPGRVLGGTTSDPGFRAVAPDPCPRDRPG